MENIKALLITYFTKFPRCFSRREAFLIKAVEFAQVLTILMPIESDLPLYYNSAGTFYNALNFIVRPDVLLTYIFGTHLVATVILFVLAVLSIPACFAAAHWYRKYRKSPKFENWFSTVGTALHMLDIILLRLLFIPIVFHTSFGLTCLYLTDDCEDVGLANNVLCLATFLFYVHFASYYHLLTFSYSWYTPCQFTGGTPAPNHRRCFAMAALAIVTVHMKFSEHAEAYCVVMGLFSVYVGGQYFYLLPYHRFWINFVEVEQSLIMCLYAMILSIYQTDSNISVPLTLLLIFPFVSASAWIFLIKFKNYRESNIVATSQEVYEL